MNNYYRSSEYYPDDKDIHDFLETTDASLSSMMGFLSEYGILCSVVDPKEDIQEYVSYLYLSWPRATQLLELVDARESVENSTPRDFPHLKVKDETILAAADAIKKLRSSKEREVYDIQQNGTDVEISVSYIDVDSSRTRILQKRQKDLTIVLSNTANGLRVTHTSNKRAHGIADRILGKIGEIEKKKGDEIKEANISFKGVNNVKARVNFFKAMMNGLSGLNLKNVVHLRVNRLEKANAPESSDSEGDEQDEELVVANDAVSKVIIYGNQLFETAEFQDLVGKGFYVSSGTWKSETAEGEREVIEFHAGFIETDAREAFTFKVLGRYPLIDGVLSETRHTLSQADAKGHADRLVAAAREAFQKMQSDAQKEEKQ